MQHDILRSVINITGQRDVESLEYSLLVTIPELMPIRTLSLYKPLKGEGYENVEELLRFHMKETFPDCGWSEEPIILPANNQLQDCFVNSRFMETSGVDSNTELYFPIVINGKTEAVLRVESNGLNEAQRVTLDGLTKVYRNFLTILIESQRDKLTSLLNRRTFDHSFSKLLATQKKSQKIDTSEYNTTDKRVLTDADQAYLAILDIDFFKKINDNFGHAYGDEILLIMANLMRESFRNSDLLFRFGGEEFVILLEPTSSNKAFSVLEYYRQRVAAFDFPRVGKVTLSIGYTAVSNDVYSSDTLGRADRALYYSKGNGRNCTSFYETLVHTGLMLNDHKISSIELF